LRTARGLDLEKYKQDFGEDFLEKYSAVLQKVATYVEVSGNFLKIKDEFLFIQNGIIIEFLQ
ncbi:MAG: hypothetical protein HDQ88_06785, partial [Clostridia bacterium]|nr:hypothetical protein [Clostridia bacterium]